MDTPADNAAILEHENTSKEGSENTSGAPTEGDQAQVPPVDWEKRFKDTQAAYTKSQQKLAATTAELEVVKKSSTNKFAISEADQSRLDELKYSDPDAWMEEVNTLKENHKQEIAKQVELATKNLTEVEQRQITLENFMAANPGFEMNDDIMEYDLPPRITSKFKSGEMSFETFLEESHKYLGTPKKVGTPNKTLNQPNLGETGGDDTPTKNTSKDAPGKKSYNAEVY